MNQLIFPDLTAEYEYEQAIEHLLTLHQQDDIFEGAAAKGLAMALINMLKQTQPEIAGHAQQKLSNILIK